MRQGAVSMKRVSLSLECLGLCDVQQEEEGERKKSWTQVGPNHSDTVSSSVLTFLKFYFVIFDILGLFSCNCFNAHNSKPAERLNKFE